MQPASVVIFLDELLQSSVQVFEVAVRAGVNLFALESFQKTLAGGIVVWIRRPTHARQHPMIEELLDVLSAGMLILVCCPVNNWDNSSLPIVCRGSTYRVPDSKEIYGTLH